MKKMINMSVRLEGDMNAQSYFYEKYGEIPCYVSCEEYAEYIEYKEQVDKEIFNLIPLIIIAIIVLCIMLIMGIFVIEVILNGYISLCR